MKMNVELNMQCDKAAYYYFSYIALFFNILYFLNIFNTHILFSDVRYPYIRLT